MTTYNFLDEVGLTPSSQTWELVTNTRVFRSPLTNAIQTASRKGSLWKTTATSANLSGISRAKMRAFLTKLNGQEHRVKFRDFGYSRTGSAPSGDSWTGSAGLNVKTGSQTGSSVDLTGTSVNISNYFRAGDVVSFDNGYYVISEDCDSSSNDVTIPIAPALRTSPPAGAGVEFIDPVAVMIVTSTASWDTRPGLVSNFTFEAIEDVLA